MPVTGVCRSLASLSLGECPAPSRPERFLRFAAGFRDQAALTIGAVTFDIESCRVIRDRS